MCFKLTINILVVSGLKISRVKLNENNYRETSRYFESNTNSMKSEF